MARNMATKKATEKAVDGPFAVIETGGKQYVVVAGDILDVELLRDHKAGDKVEFDTVLLTDDGTKTTVGNPYVKGAKVTATYVEEKKGTKLSIVRYKAKSNRDRKIGHRQHYARIKIESVA